MNSFTDLSIIIPVGPNDLSWQNLLNELTLLGNKIEIIISACQKQPVDLKLPKNVKWIYSTQGRAKQLNAGAEKSTRKTVWFLHADTQLTEGVCHAIHSYLDMNDQGLGYFKLKFSNDGPRQMQLNAWAANIRSRHFGLPFGDQGFVMNKSVFDQLKGFDESLKLGEDLDFVVRAKSSGIGLHELASELVTSSRRYKQYGWLSTTMRYVWLTWFLTRQAKQRAHHT